MNSISISWQTFYSPHIANLVQSFIPYNVTPFLVRQWIYLKIAIVTHIHFFLHLKIPLAKQKGGKGRKQTFVGR